MSVIWQTYSCPPSLEPSWEFKFEREKDPWPAGPDTAREPDHQRTVTDNKPDSFELQIQHDFLYVQGTRRSRVRSELWRRWSSAGEPLRFKIKLSQCHSVRFITGVWVRTLLPTTPSRPLSWATWHLSGLSHCHNNDKSIPYRQVTTVALIFYIHSYLIFFCDPPLHRERQITQTSMRSKSASTGLVFSQRERSPRDNGDEKFTIAQMTNCKVMWM